MASESVSAALAAPLLPPDVRPMRSSDHSVSVRSRLRRCAVAALMTSKAERRGSRPSQPSLKAAIAHAEFFLPKAADGKLLPLNCSEAEFTAHLGNGVSIYMQFVRATGTMFAFATLIALPQYWANLHGGALELEWPWSSPECMFDANLSGHVARVMSTVGFCFYSLLLGNMSFDATHGLLHLVSELLLCVMFCIYVYLIYWQNRQGLQTSEAKAVRASDFAVKVSRLPALGVRPNDVAAHFAFFGPVASVALSTDNEELLRLLERQADLKATWRRLHLEYSRQLSVVTAERAQRQYQPPLTPAAASGAKPTKAEQRTEHLLARMERQWVEVLRARQQLHTTAAAAVQCTGHAIVVFRFREHAEKCVRHFLRIRQHERSPDGSVAAPDFRQLYLQGVATGGEHDAVHKLEVARAPEPSDILWTNLRYSHLQARSNQIWTSLIIFLVSCVSTLFITATTFVTTVYSKSIFTTLWSTPVIILSNVAIFVLVPRLAVHLEREHTRSSQQLFMLFKMVFFQLFNTIIATSSFLFMPNMAPPEGTLACPLPAATPDRLPAPAEASTACFLPMGANGGLYFDPRCVKHWYTTGAAVLINVVIGDCAVILGVIDFIRPDKWILRYVVAPRQSTQAEMNASYALDSETYLPFRYQLVLKVVCITFAFSPAIPLLLPIAALFMYASYWVDRYNLLRVFKPPPRTTDRTVTMSVLYILPLAVFGHLLSAIFFYSKQVHQDVPLIYYLCLTFLAMLVMARIRRELTIQSQRAPPQLDDDIDDAPLGEAAADTSSELRHHLDAIELYVPPLSHMMLLNVWRTTPPRL